MSDIHAAPRKDGRTWLDEHLPSADDQRIYAQEACIVAATETIAGAMSAAGLNRKEVAERLGKSPAFVTKTLNGPGNLTLRTVGDLLWACGIEVVGFETVPLGEIVVAVDHLKEATTVQGSAAGSGTSIDAIDWSRIVVHACSNIAATMVFETATPQRTTPALAAANNNFALAA